MKIVMTGGGSGGHITPILAVAHELKQRDAAIEIIYVGQKGDHLSDIPAQDPSIDAVYSVPAGKLRRYADEDWRQLLNIRVQALNIRDMFRVLAGLWQSYWLLRKLQPDIIFTRGGFVSVPVALGGQLNHIPYITHDSDSVPSLANRLIARWAAMHAVALPKELYPYPANKTEVVGVPIAADFKPVDAALRRHYRQELKLPAEAPVLMLTGGGNGARSLNKALVANAKYLLGMFPDLSVLHIAGRAHLAETRRDYDSLGLPASAKKRLRIEGFVTDLYRYSGAADVVIARGGATTLAGLAAQGAACIIVPAQMLGWDVKNAQALADRHAIVQLNGDQAEQPERLGRVVEELLDDESLRKKLGTTLATFARPHATSDLANLLLSIGGKGHVQTKK